MNAFTGLMLGAQVASGITQIYFDSWEGSAEDKKEFSFVDDKYKVQKERYDKHQIVDDKISKLNTMYLNCQTMPALLMNVNNAINELAKSHGISPREECHLYDKRDIERSPTMVPRIIITTFGLTLNIGIEYIACKKHKETDEINNEFHRKQRGKSNFDHHAKDVKKSVSDLPKAKYNAKTDDYGGSSGIELQNTKYFGEKFPEKKLQEINRGDEKFSEIKSEGINRVDGESYAIKSDKTGAKPNDEKFKVTRLKRDEVKMDGQTVRRDASTRGDQMRSQSLNTERDPQSIRNHSDFEHKGGVHRKRGGSINKVHPESGKQRGRDIATDVHIGLSPSFSRSSNRKKIENLTSNKGRIITYSSTTCIAAGAALISYFDYKKKKKTIIENIEIYKRILADIEKFNKETDKLEEELKPTFSKISIQFLDYLKKGLPKNLYNKWDSKLEKLELSQVDEYIKYQEDIIAEIKLIGVTLIQLATLTKVLSDFILDFNNDVIDKEFIMLLTRSILNSYSEEKLSEEKILLSLNNCIDLMGIVKATNGEYRQLEPHEIQSIKLKLGINQ